MDLEQLKMQQGIAGQAKKILDKYHLVYLSMEMRVGKTHTAFITCKNKKYKKVLMFTKKKAITDLVKQAGWYSNDFEFLITNFEQIPNYHDWNFEPDVIIIDEAHSLGQYPKPAVRVTGHKKTKTTPAVIGLKQICEGKDIIYLSGTPTPESYSQIYHQFCISSFSPFKEYESFYKWAEEYVIVSKKYMGQIAINDYSNARESKIKEEMEHLFISKTQEEAGFTQVVQEEIKIVPTKPATKYLIEKLIKDRVVVGNDDSVILAETEVKLQGKIHQIASGTVKIEGGDEAKVFDDSKAKYIRDNYAGKKIAIYYKFKAEYVAILCTFGYDHLTEDPVVFNETDHLTIFVSQVSSGREGVDLRAADVLIMYNIDYSAVSYFQVRQRMQTKTRERAAMVHWLFSDTGVEQKVYDKVVGKKDYTLSYFKNDFGVKSTSIKFKSKSGSEITIHAPTADSAAFKKKMFELMDEGKIDDVVQSLEKKYKTKLK